MLTWAEVGPERRMAKRSSSCPDEEERRNPFRLGVEPDAAWQAHGGRLLPDAHLLKGKAMDRLGNIVFDDQEIENERLELTDAKANDILGTQQRPVTRTSWLRGDGGLVRATSLHQGSNALRPSRGAALRHHPG